MRVALLVLGILLCLLGGAVTYVGRMFDELGVSLVYFGIAVSWQLGLGVLVVGALVIVGSRLMKGAPAASRS
jgi:hypothetical protein